jgi:hypothetical protein
MEIMTAVGNGLLGKARRLEEHANGGRGPNGGAARAA